MASRAPLSVGTDLVEVRRIARLVRDTRFLARVFTAEEVRYCRTKRNAAQHFAVRFAAKEAVWKALGDVPAIRGIALKSIGVRRAPSGKPAVLLPARLKRFEKKLALSLSHTSDYATAVAVYLAR